MTLEWLKLRIWSREMGNSTSNQSLESLRFTSRVEANLAEAANLELQSLRRDVERSKPTTNELLRECSVQSTNCCSCKHKLLQFLPRLIMRREAANLPQI
jgi:hypothetical protein